MFFACEVWCIADVSRVTPSSFSRRRENAIDIGRGAEQVKTYHISPCCSNPYSVYSPTQKKHFFFKTSPHSVYPVKLVYLLDY